MVKLHCLAALHLHAVAREYNSIGIVAEESGEAIHAKWNKLASRFYGMRGGRKDKSAVLELERSQEPATCEWIKNMLLATQRFDENKKVFTFKSLQYHFGLRNSRTLTITPTKHARPLNYEVLAMLVERTLSERRQQSISCVRCDR